MVELPFCTLKTMIHCRLGKHRSYQHPLKGVACSTYQLIRKYTMSRFGFPQFVLKLGRIGRPGLLLCIVCKLVEHSIAALLQRCNILGSVRTRRCGETVSP